MTAYSPVKVRQDLYEQIRIKAAADGRSIMNYVEQLILKDITPVIDLVGTTSDSDTGLSNPPAE